MKIRSDVLELFCSYRRVGRGILIGSKENTNALKMGYCCPQIPQSLD